MGGLSCQAIAISPSQLPIVYYYHCTQLYDIRDLENITKSVIMLILFPYSESEIPERRFGFNGREDITVSLLSRPNSNLLVSEISSISIWCQPFNVDFGRLSNIPANLTASLPVQ